MPLHFSSVSPVLCLTVAVFLSKGVMLAGAEEVSSSAGSGREAASAAVQADTGTATEEIISISEETAESAPPPPPAAVEETISTPEEAAAESAPPPATSVVTPLPVRAPTGFDRRPLSLLPDSAAEGFKTEAGISAVYDSNLRRRGGFTNGEEEDGEEEDDVIFSFTPQISWRSSGSRWFLSGEAGLDYSEYLTHSEFSGLGYSTNLAGGFTGGKLDLNASVDYSLDRGMNRYYGAFIEEHRFDAELSGSWRISSKTSLDGSLSYRWSDPEEEGEGENAGFSSTDTLSAKLAAMWRATPLLRIGPGVSYSKTGGERHTDREAAGPLLRADYRLASKVSLNGTVGLEFTEYGGGTAASDEFLTAGLGLNYRASALWGADFSLLRSARANGSAGNSYRETTAFRAGINRKIHRAALRLGASYETGEVVFSSTGDDSGASLEYLTLEASLSMPLSKRTNGSVFFLRREEDGYRSSGGGSQTGVSLSMSF